MHQQLLKSKTTQKHKLSPSVWLLTSTQALIGSVSPMVVFIGGLIGVDLAPSKNLATLPVAAIVVGTACSTIPITLLMRKLGRKQTFIGISLLSILVALLAAYTIYLRSFYFLCLSTFLLGITNAATMQFRFAAMESVAPKLFPKAASTVLLGGIAAAYLGPEIGLQGKALFGIDYVGSFVLLSVLFAIALLIFMFYQNPVIQDSQNQKEQRNLKEISQQSVFWVAISAAAIGYAIMSFIMTATPISMHQMDGHSLAVTKTVIQSHIVAMFLPSLFTAWIIHKIGIARMMLLGLVAYIFCILIAYLGQGIVNYWFSLVLLGVGWNFLFIGGTALLPQSYQPAERFKVQAFNEFLVFSSQALAALSAGSIIFIAGWKIVLLIAIPLIILQVGIVLRWQNQTK